MTTNWQDTLRAIGFRPYGDLGAMRARVEDVEFDAIPHPLKGLSISVTHIGSRTATSYEKFLPLDSDVQTVAKLMAEAFESIHPERRDEARE
ncbi:hypothetical protein ACIBEJ_30295 [Nonomuraea sp. NPDC050790]|uniref:hypothetical protein n=1 Tax=Nonomuraea sp. NPDC050790 TaxID=3364371 RepID=UPI00379E7FC6